jgi:hypothetical protein
MKGVTLFFLIHLSDVYILQKADDVSSLDYITLHNVGGTSPGQIRNYLLIRQKDIILVHCIHTEASRLIRLIF